MPVHFFSLSILVKIPCNPKGLDTLRGHTWHGNYAVRAWLAAFVTVSSRVPYILIEWVSLCCNPLIRDSERIYSSCIRDFSRSQALVIMGGFDKSVRRYFWALVSPIISMKVDEVYCVYKATTRKFSLADQPRAQCEMHDSVVVQGYNQSLPNYSIYGPAAWPSLPTPWPRTQQSFSALSVSYRGYQPMKIVRDSCVHKSLLLPEVIHSRKKQLWASITRKRNSLTWDRTFKKSIYSQQKHRFYHDKILIHIPSNL